MHMAWEAKKHPAKNIMKMGFIYTNARQNVIAIKYESRPSFIYYLRLI
jgi:hypothetical protein